MPERTRIGTVIVLTRDVRASRAFYADLLGLPVLSDEDGMVTLDAGVPLLLHPADSPQPSRASINLQFLVADVDGLIEEAGLTVLTPPHDTEYGVREAEVLDPDGHAVFLAQPL
ncbi:glyoxalase/bleomycin resistance protein/dioxygenase [Deinococcus aerius]|uniref:Glyoxalase/bleomycin resistance protein/dioxygenase n=1 Tax=Deinococcus aerius TaxID=200253 RepID=A0A2I9CRU7_9DEIO|nr:VOC family protein [Deinococcus aerius]GBF04264.1 glyoxalase/bleomycin resistance protein/dioxygenase [Deinococcus aerius]